LRSDDSSSSGGKASSAERHLGLLRSWLRRDFLTRASWRDSLVETAQAARTIVSGRRAFIALKGEDDAWQGYMDDGAALDSTVIKLVGSMTLLDEVYGSLEPVITSVARPLTTKSRSIARNDIRNVLVVPIRWWQRRGDAAEARPAGCLYVDRPGDAVPFEEEDVQIVLDLTSMLERTLGVLRQLIAVETQLTRARRQLHAQFETGWESHRLHDVQSRDPSFVRNVLEPLRRAARADRVGLLLIGPTGAGKSHLAQTFHYESRRREGPFVVLDCGQVSSSEVLGAELFGFARHSGFNAPKEGRLGKAALADGGTLFIDEVGTLALDLQQRLLRLLEKGRFTPLGGSEEIEVDVQVAAASNEDLSRLVREGAFREDLYWRLSEVAIRVPPLDERRADIPELVTLFLAKAAERFDRGSLTGIDGDALRRLVEFPWSNAGNTRGLEHAVNRSVLMTADDQRVLMLDDLVLPELLGPAAPATARAPDAVPRAALRSQPLRDLLAECIDEHGGVIAKIATAPRLVAAFGLASPPVPASTVRLRIRQLGLEERLHAARARAELRLDDVLAALREHRSGADAARSLGITRDALAWRLRQAGLSIRQVLGGSPDES
jgi:transcriptional regulator with GAF, ATPase, and Fis domain